MIHLRASHARFPILSLANKPRENSSFNNGDKHRQTIAMDARPPPARHSLKLNPNYSKINLKVNASLQANPSRKVNAIKTSPEAMGDLTILREAAPKLAVGVVSMAQEVVEGKHLQHHKLH